MLSEIEAEGDRDADGETDAEGEIEAEAEPESVMASCTYLHACVTTPE